MQYVKTFENFSQTENFELNEGAVSWLKDVFGKVTEKFSKWRDKRAKEAAIKFAVVLEQHANDPKVKAQLKKIGTAYSKLSPEEKSQLEDFMSSEKKMQELGKILDKAEVEKVVPIKENINEELFEASKNTFGKILQRLGIAGGLLSVVVMIISLLTMEGAGYVASWCIGAGMPIGEFIAICAGVVFVSIGVASAGAAMQK